MKGKIGGATASLMLGLFLMQQSVPTVSAQGLAAPSGHDPRVEELLRKLQQLTTPQQQPRNRAGRASTKTHIIAKFNIVEKSTTVCERSAVLTYQVLNANSEFFSGTSTKAMKCASGKCTAAVHAYVRVLNADPNQKINVFPSVSSNCPIKQSGNNYLRNNSLSQTASFPGDSLNHGGKQTTKVVGDI